MFKVNVIARNPKHEELVFAESGDMPLIGVRTLEGFGVMVDNIGHRFLATTTIVASAASWQRPFLP